jgi:hypothetical protein
MLSSSKLLLAALTFNPRTLSPRAWLDGADTSTFYDATSGGSLVANNGAIARLEDKSTNLFHFTQATAGKRPLRVDNFLNGRSVVMFDGVDDQLRNASISFAAGTSGSHAIFAVAYNSADYNTATNPEYCDMMRAGTGEIASFVFGSKRGLFATFYGNNAANWIDTNNNSPNSNVQAPVLLSVITNGNTATPYFNGTAMSTKVCNAAVTYSNFGIGSTDAATSKNMWRGPIAELLIFNRVVTNAERDQIHAYLSAKWGFNFAQFTGFDPDAARYISRVFAAGSSMTASNMNAVNTFVLGCKSDNIWNAIQGCSLLAGPDTLAGALMPLVGPVLTNFNFVDADYNRTTGLKGNGTNKYLRLNLDNWYSTNTRHMVCWMTERMSSPPSSEQFMGFWNNTNGSFGLATVTLNTTLQYRSGTNTAVEVAGAIPLAHTGMIGISRSGANNTDCKTGTNAIVSNANAYNAAQVAGTYTLFSRAGSSPSYSGSRFSFYSVGVNLNLNLLNARIATYMSSLT